MTRWCDCSGSPHTGAHDTEQDPFGLRKEGLRGAKLAVYDGVLGRHREGKARFLEIVRRT